ncbi:hypothetical protein [Bartonella sp. AA86SXKL]|uniref:hypothetical protein n=1 Tax=Bartonella sp. AA86SXKL TaxID=3243441 RepID=UPI0035D08CBD
MTVVGRLGRRGANGGWLDCAMRQNWNGGMEGVGGKGLLAMNRLMIGFNEAVYRKCCYFL